MIENIAYAGGGMKGYSYVGVIKYLEEKNIIKNIKRISGTSIGSIVGLLQALGYSSSEMKNIIVNIDICHLENINIGSFVNDYGLDNGKGLKKLLYYLIERKTQKKTMTFKDLYDFSGIELFITSCDINSNKEVVFSYNSTPDIEVVYACRCSCSIPFVFSPVDDRYIDGCFSNNLPIQLLPIENTLGFYAPVVKSIYSKSDIKNYAARIMSCLAVKSLTSEIQKYKVLGYTCVDIPVTTSALNLNIDNDSIIQQIDIGYKACFFY